MKIRNGFVSNSSSSSFVIDSNDGEAEHIKADILDMIRGHDYDKIVLDEAKKYVEVIVVKNDNDISEVKKRIPNFEEWGYDESDIDIGKTWIFDNEDNVIPYDIKLLIIGKYKCYKYNLHMG